MDRRILIIGHSHTGPLILAQRPEEAAFLTIVNLFAAGDVLDMTSGVMNLAARRWPAAEVVCLQVGGNWHNLAGLIESPLPFALGCPVAGAAPARPGGRRFVPSDMMRAWAETQTRAERLVAEHIHAFFAGARFVHIAAPPPIADEAHLAAHPGPFAPLVARGFAPRALRRRLYEIQRDLDARHAAALGAAFVESPAAAQTRDGLLARRYCRADPTHGNAAYGRLVLDGLLACEAVAA